MAEKKWSLELNILSRQAQWNFIPRWRNIYAPEKVEYEQERGKFLKSQTFLKYSERNTRMYV